MLVSLRALGFFLIYIDGQRYGVKKWDATMLANSFDEVGSRIARRGSHKPPFAMNANGDEVGYSIRRAIYDECAEDERFFGIPVRRLGKRLIPTISNGLQTAMRPSMITATCCN